MPAGETKVGRLALPTDGSDAIVLEGSTGIATFGSDVEVNGGYVRALDHRIPGALRIGYQSYNWTDFADASSSKTLVTWTPVAVPGVTFDAVVCDVWFRLVGAFAGTGITSASLQIGEDETPDADAYVLSTSVFGGLTPRWEKAGSIKTAQMTDGTTVILSLDSSLTTTLTVGPTSLNNLTGGRVTVWWSYYHMPAPA